VRLSAAPQRKGRRIAPAFFHCCIFFSCD